MAAGMSGPAVIGKERAQATSTIGLNGAREAMDGSCAAAAGIKAKSDMSAVVMTVAATTGAMKTGVTTTEAAIIARQDKRKKAIASSY